MSNDYFDAVAPTWESPEKIKRSKKFAKIVTDNLRVNSRKQLLDYGCGTGVLGLSLSEQFEKTKLVDTSAGMISEIQKKLSKIENKKIEALQADLSGYDASIDLHNIDVVVSSMAFHHIPNTKQTLENLHEVMVPGGQLFIFDFDSDGGIMHHNIEDFSGHHGFSREALTSTCTAANFEVDSIETVHQMEVSRDGQTKEVTIFLLQATAKDK